MCLLHDHRLNGISLLLLLTMMFAAVSCMKMRTDEQGTKKAFEKIGYDVDVKTIDVEGRNLRYLITGKKAGCNILVIYSHGAPGSSNNSFKVFEDSIIQANCTLIAYDRPGYGYSEFGKAETSFDFQAKCIGALIKAHPADSVVLIGHSFGGPIVATAAMKYPELIDLVIMVGPAIDPEQEKIWAISHLARFFPFRQMTPKPLRVATDEKFTHVDELNRIKPYWGDLKARVIHIHGDNDQIVPFTNVEFSRKHIPLDRLKVVKINGENHFIPFSRPDYITSELHNYLRVWE